MPVTRENTTASPPPHKLGRSKFCRQFDGLIIEGLKFEYSAHTNSANGNPQFVTDSHRSRRNHIGIDRGAHVAVVSQRL